MLPPLLLRAAVLSVMLRASAVQFVPVTNPIPLAALELTYKAARNEWLLVDRFAMPYERLLVKVCVARDAAMCDLALVHATASCAELAAHPSLAAPGWRSVDTSADACLRLPSAAGSGMRIEAPNALVLANNFALLRPFDMRNASDGSVALRVRFVYVQGLGADAAHVHAAGYDIEMQALQDTPLAVLVQSECRARGFGAPHSHLAPALGGSLLHVVLVNVTGASAPERVCAWQCVPPFLKMPWNAPAIRLDDASSSSPAAAACVRAPVSMNSVALSFEMLGYFSGDIAASRQVLLGIDSLAVRMAAELSGRFGPVQVLLSLRGSVYNARQVQEIGAWVRAFNRVESMDFVETRNSAFALASPPAGPNAGTRRLLQQSTTTTLTRITVDAVIVAPSSPDASCCLAGSAAQVTGDATPADYDFGTNVQSFDTPQVEYTQSVVRRTEFVSVQVQERKKTSSSDAVLFWLPILLILFVVGVFVYQNPKK